MEERLSAVLSGDDRLSDDIADIAESLSDLADDAIETALGLERAEDAADALDRSMVPSPPHTSPGSVWKRLGLCPRWPQYRPREPGPNYPPPKDRIARNKI